jgi:Adenylate and Guanylate cyclase catalytic domain
VVNAVECAVEIQTALKAENVNLSAERRMDFRIGVNLGDVVVDGEQIYGDGINVAARLESLANPGGICISSTVHEQVRDKLALTYEDGGEQRVKNIARPVHAWRVHDKPGIRFKDLDEPALKNVSRPMDIYQLVASDLVAQPKKLDGRGLRNATSIGTWCVKPSKSAPIRDCQTLEGGMHRIFPRRTSATPN